MISAQCRMARAALQLGVRDLADLAKVSPATVVRFEAGGELRERTVDAIRAALEGAGVIFVDENGEGAGVRLRKSKAGAALLAPVGPATDVVAKMDEAIESHRRSKKS